MNTFSHCIFLTACLLSASAAQPASLTEIRGKLTITVTAGVVFVRPSPLNYSDDCQGWLHLERSASLPKCSTDLHSWQTVDYYYGTWKDFELKDVHPPTGVSIYRVAFFEEP